MTISSHTFDVLERIAESGRYPEQLSASYARGTGGVDVDYIVQMLDLADKRAFGGLPDGAELAGFPIDWAKNNLNRVISGGAKSITERLKGVGIGIKPLDWAQHPSGRELWKAVTILGQYQASALTVDPQWQFDGYDGTTANGYSGSIDQAKADATADYERRISEELVVTGDYDKDGVCAHCGQDVTAHGQNEECPSTQ